MKQCKGKGLVEVDKVLHLIGCNRVNENYIVIFRNTFHILRIQKIGFKYLFVASNYYFNRFSVILLISVL